MSSQSDFVKLGGLFGFAVVFLAVLLKSKDVASAVMDASIACVVMAFAFKKWFDYSIHLKNEVASSRQVPEDEPETETDPSLQSLTSEATES